jgi:hypothetical protein
MTRRRDTSLIHTAPQSSTEKFLTKTECIADATLQVTHQDRRPSMLRGTSLAGIRDAVRDMGRACLVIKDPRKDANHG